MATTSFSTAEARIIHSYDNRCYSGHFFSNGNAYYSCGQDFRIRIYDTSDLSNWREQKIIEHPSCHWTITDAALSPDNHTLASSTISSKVCLGSVGVTQEASTSEPAIIDFQTHPTGLTERAQSNFAIFALDWPADNQILAGTTRSDIRIYDLEKATVVEELNGHLDDVNAVCTDSSMSPSIIFSGSDDTTIRIWDRREYEKRSLVGAFVGHTEGLTALECRNDGRYLVSNGKDQCMKLWDMRKTSSLDVQNEDVGNYSTGFDYRFQEHDTELARIHPHDCSIATYLGHSVLKTAVRCHFSHHKDFGHGYVYTGSAGDSIYVYSLSGQVGTPAGQIKVNDALRGSNPVYREEEQPPSYRKGESGQEEELRKSVHDALQGLQGSKRRPKPKWQTVVRDASWHPFANAIAASSWTGYGYSAGATSLHVWKDSTS